MEGWGGHWPRGGTIGKVQDDDFSAAGVGGRACDHVRTGPIGTDETKRVIGRGRICRTARTPARAGGAIGAVDG